MGIYLHSLYHVNTDYSNGEKKVWNNCTSQFKSMDRPMEELQKIIKRYEYIHIFDKRV